MKAAIYIDGNKFIETDFNKEEHLETVVRDNCKTLFGKKTIYLDSKNKIDAKFLGSSIPDGFLFDFKDKENPEFYIVEIELRKHDFYKHIFPQVTKFFAFFKHAASRENLLDKLFHYVKSNENLENEFKKFLGKKETYKGLKDIIENSQNILLILDGNKPELAEVFETYTDTWDKIVRVVILKQYSTKKKTIFTLDPDFEGVLIEPSIQVQQDEEKYTERFHLEDAAKNVVSIYLRIKKEIIKFDSAIKINPQKYYISLRENKNFAFLKIKKKKLNLIIMLPYKEGKKLIKKHKLDQLNEKVQIYYNGPCFRVRLENESNFNEIMKALHQAYKLQNK